MTIFQLYLSRKRQPELIVIDKKLSPTEEHKQMLLRFTKNNQGKIKTVFKHKENKLLLYQGMYKVALEYDDNDKPICYCFYRGIILKDVKYLNKEN